MESPADLARRRQSGDPRHRAALDENASDERPDDQVDERPVDQGDAREVSAEGAEEDEGGTPGETPEPKNPTPRSPPRSTNASAGVEVARAAPADRPAVAGRAVRATGSGRSIRPVGLRSPVIGAIVVGIL